MTLDQTPPTLSSSSIDLQWQQVGQPVDLNVTASDSSPLYLGDVQAEISGPESTTRYLLPGAGDTWQESFSGGLEGEYTIDFSVYDRAGNEASASHTLIVDGTPPDISLTLSTNGDYGYTQADTIYYGDGSGDFTVTASMADSLSKLDTVTFPTSASLGASYNTPNGLDSASESHLYNFDSSNSEAGPYDVVVTDRAGNSTPASFELVNDEVGPTVLIDVPPTSGLGVPVSWEGLDIGAGVRHYEVQVKEAGGSWTAWLSDVSYSQATYIGGAGKSYTFQIKATDNVNNESVWVESGSVSVEAVTKYYTFGGQKVAMRQGSEVYYLGGDHLGSTSLTTDSSGGVVSEVRYRPYGEVRWSNGTSVTDFGFTSQRNEASFGLMDYNARYYSAVLGRFVSPDTIVPDPSSSGGFNRYRYVRNNPLKYTDPSGHCSSLSGTAWSVCASVVTTVAPAVHKANEYRDDIFFPDANTTTWDRVEASTVVGAGPVSIAGGIMAAPAAVPYVYSASASWTTLSASQPFLAGAGVGVVETAAECGLNGGCTAGDYLMGGLTAGIANAGNGVKPTTLISEPEITVPYKRPSGATTKAQRQFVQGKPCVDCGTIATTQVADHKYPLVKEYYETGTIDLDYMHSLDAVQSQCPTCSARQGAELSRYSRQKREELGF